MQGDNQNIKQLIITHNLTGNDFQTEWHLNERQLYRDAPIEYFYICDYKGLQGRIVPCYKTKSWTWEVISPFILKSGMGDYIARPSKDGRRSLHDCMDAVSIVFIGIYGPDADYR